jgi:gliding motility-associated-like protein
MKTRSTCFVFLCLFSLAGLLLPFSLKAGNAKLDFVENKNQWPAVVEYQAKIPGGEVYLTKTGFRYSFYSQADIRRIHDQMLKDPFGADSARVSCHSIDVQFTGASMASIIEGKHRRNYNHNYFLGNDPSRWASSVPVFEEVVYKSIYQGIDLLVYSSETSFKYDFVIAPGADPGKIVLQYKGAIPLIKYGKLNLETSVNTISEVIPVAFQVINGVQHKVSCRFKLLGNGKVSFDIPGKYDNRYPLTIDPILVFATYSGSVGVTYGYSATYDTSGNSYAAGTIFTTGWPVTVGAFQQSFVGSTDVAINKYNPTGTSLIYSTYYGGSHFDRPNSLLANDAGELIVCGSTKSVDFPVTPGSYDQTFNGQRDIFLGRINANGSVLSASTFIGGSDEDGINYPAANYGDENRCDISLEPNGEVNVVSCTRSFNFPTTAGVFQPTWGGGQQDGCIFRMNSSFSSLLWSTLIGGNNTDALFSFTRDGQGNFVIAGSSGSSNYPTTPGVIHANLQGSVDGIVSIINNNATALLYSTYLGTTSNDLCFKIQMDLDGSIVVCGQTSGQYPISTGAYFAYQGGVFFDRLMPDLTASIRSTRLIPSGIIPTAFFLDSCSNIYLCGWNGIPFLPTTPDAFQPYPLPSTLPTSFGSFYLSIYDPTFSTLKYATFLGSKSDHTDGGSSRCDSKGIVYHTVCCVNSNFPTSPGCWSATNQVGSYDVLNFKFDFQSQPVHAAFQLAPGYTDTTCINAPVLFVNTSHAASSYHWDFGDGSTDTFKNPATHYYTLPGDYIVKLAAHKQGFCITDDTAYMVIHVIDLKPPSLLLNDTLICKGVPINLTANIGNPNANQEFSWTPASAIISNPHLQSIIANAAIEDSFKVVVRDSINIYCNVADSGIIVVDYFDYSVFKAFSDTSICAGDTVSIQAIGGDFYLWSPDLDISSLVQPQVSVWPSEPTSYYVKISNELGCDSLKQVRIEINPPLDVDLGPDKDIRIGESTTLYANGGNQYNWFTGGAMFSTASSVLVTPPVTTEYTVVASSGDKCKAIDTIIVHVINVAVPTAFSPNGDGRNDIFHLILTDARARLKNLTVFNRWGEKIYYTNNINDGWDGSYKGEACEVGTYFYYVDYEIGQKEYHLKGDVSLVR